MVGYDILETVETHQRIIQSSSIEPHKKRKGCRLDFPLWTKYPQRCCLDEKEGSKTSIMGYAYSERSSCTIMCARVSFLAWGDREYGVILTTASIYSISRVAVGTETISSSVHSRPIERRSLTRPRPRPGSHMEHPIWVHHTIEGWVSVCIPPFAPRFRAGIDELSWLPFPMEADAEL